MLDDASTAQNRDPITYPAPGLSAANTLRAGDTLPTGVTGVLDQRFDLYRIQPVGVINWTQSNARPATPPAVGGTLRVAGANMLNYFTTLDTGGTPCGPAGGQACRGANTSQELTRQQAKLVQELKGLNADVIGLMEIENALTDVPLQTLRDALNTASGGTPYEIIATGPLGSDAIRVGLLYRKANVTPVGAFQTNTDATFSRPPVAQTFQDNSTREKFSVVVNHFKSKGCGGASGADQDQGDGQGCYNARRVAQATLLLSFINGVVIPNSGNDPDVLIIGDLNAYAREDPVTTLRNGGYTDLVSKYRGAGGYSYLFDGQAGYLDHALASASLTAQATGTDEWHINAAEPVSLDYNTEFKSAGQQASLYAADPYRAADHDPVIVGLGLCPAAANPTDLAIALNVSENGVDLIWSPTAGATSYQIWRETTPYFTPDPVHAQPLATAPASPHTDRDVLGPSRPNYYYTVIGVNACGRPAAEATGLKHVGKFGFSLVPGQ